MVGVKMRGTNEMSGSLFSYVDLEDRIPARHPLRKIRQVVNDALASLDGEFVPLYADFGRPSIAPERLIRASLIQILFSVRSERQLMEQMQYNLMFRWFVGLGIDDPVWVATVFTKNRDRLLTTDMSRKVMAAILAHREVAPLLSDEHFSVDGTLIKAWASMKSFQPKAEGTPPDDEGPDYPPTPSIDSDNQLICVVPAGRNLAAANIRPGDVAPVSGVLGNHGAAILAVRGDLMLSTTMLSDCQSLGQLMDAVLAATPSTVAARDAMRGGLASALNELAQASGAGIEIDESSVPLHPEVRGVREILGLDPLYLANEGTLVLFVPAPEVDAALAAIRATLAGVGAAIIGRAISGQSGLVTLRTLFGASRIVDMLVGEQLPRIC